MDIIMRLKFHFTLIEDNNNTNIYLNIFPWFLVMARERKISCVNE